MSLTLVAVRCLCALWFHFHLTILYPCPYICTLPLTYLCEATAWCFGAITILSIQSWISWVICCIKHDMKSHMIRTTSEQSSMKPLKFTKSTENMFYGISFAQLKTATESMCHNRNIRGLVSATEHMFFIRRHIIPKQQSIKLASEQVQAWDATIIDNVLSLNRTDIFL